MLSVCAPFAGKALSHTKLSLSQEHQNTTARLNEKIDAVPAQLNAMDAHCQEHRDALKAAQDRLHNEVHAMTEKCVSLEAHHELQTRTTLLEQELQQLREEQHTSAMQDVALRDQSLQALMQRLDMFENSWSATTIDSVEKTSMRLLAMEQKLEAVARSQREYIIRAGTNRRAEDRQIETNTRTIEIIEDETRSVKRQLAETLKLFSKKKVENGSPAVLVRSRGMY